MLIYEFALTSSKSCVIQFSSYIANSTECPGMTDKTKSCMTTVCITFTSYRFYRLICRSIETYHCLKVSYSCHQLTQFVIEFLDYQTIYLWNSCFVQSKLHSFCHAIIIISMKKIIYIFSYNSNIN